MGTGRRIGPCKRIRSACVDKWVDQRNQPAVDLTQIFVYKSEPVWAAILQILYDCKVEATQVYFVSMTHLIGDGLFSCGFSGAMGVKLSFMVQVTLLPRAWPALLIISFTSFGGTCGGCQMS